MEKYTEPIYRDVLAISSTDELRIGDYFRADKVVWVLIDIQNQRLTSIEKWSKRYTFKVFPDYDCHPFHVFKEEHDVHVYVHGMKWFRERKPPQGYRFANVGEYYPHTYCWWTKDSRSANGGKWSIVVRKPYDTSNILVSNDSDVVGIVAFPISGTKIGEVTTIKQDPHFTDNYHVTIYTSRDALEGIGLRSIVEFKLKESE